MNDAMKATIKRSKFVAAIEAGIAATKGLTQAERIALRAVGATATTARRGCFGDQECGCPLMQIGLDPSDSDIDNLRFNSVDYPNRYVSSFARKFDGVTADIANVNGVTYLVIEEDR